MEIRSCAFTGHRKIEPEHQAAISSRVAAGIAYVYSEGCRHFYVGGAVGFDTIAAQQLLIFRMSHPDITINLVLPCKDQTSQWSDRQKEMYDYLLSQANTVEYMAENYYKGCMRARNARLVECADVVIAYLGHERSGAQQTVDMARHQGKVIYNIYNTCESAL